MPKVIHIDKTELWDDVNEEFVYVNEEDIVIEHSLWAIARWEEKYHKPFMVEKNKTNEELLDYIRIMTLNNVDPSVYGKLTQKTLKEIDAYMNDPMTATTFSKEEQEKLKKGGIDETFVTAEIVYWWMTAQNIPFECEHWHINKLITLVKVCSIKNAPDDKKKKKMTSSDLAARRAMMQARRAQYHTNG